MNKENQALLSPEVAEKFEITEDLTGGGSRQVFPGFGEINLKTMTVEDAESLVNRDFKWLRKKADSKAEAKAKAEAEKAAKAAAEAEAKAKAEAEKAEENKTEE